MAVINYVRIQGSTAAYQPGEHSVGLIASDLRTVVYQWQFGLQRPLSWNSMQLAYNVLLQWPLLGRPSKGVDLQLSMHYSMPVIYHTVGSAGALWA